MKNVVRKVIFVIGTILVLVISLFLVLIISKNDIPNESNIFSFKVTKMNEGSGDYWLYAEDADYYYSKMQFSKTSPYIKISKIEAEGIAHFSKHNYKTWDFQYLCGDLLKAYSTKPSRLEFVSCEVIEKGQVKVKATYRVKGGNSREVEDFLVKNDNLPPLKWDCCGWASLGGYGSFESNELKEINPNLTSTITMFGSAEIADATSASGVRIEMNRKKIDFFYVIVEIAII